MRTAILLSSILLLILISTVSLADGTGKIYPIKPEPKTKAIRPHTRPGALLPWPTWNEWDGADRPKYWNGYGVDPTGRNYYHYFNKYPCQYDFMVGTDRCPKEDTQKEIAQIPEPPVAILVVVGIILGLIRIQGSRR